MAKEGVRSMKCSKTISREVIAECMHTALRKGCDSLITSALWHAICVVHDEILCLYWDVVWDAIKDGKEFESKLDLVQAVKSAWRRVREACDKREDPIARRKEVLKVKYDWDVQSEIMLLYCLGDAMNEDDWMGFCCFLFDW